MWTCATPSTAPGSCGKWGDTASASPRPAALLACVLLCACQAREEPPVQTDWSESQIARALWDSQGEGEAAGNIVSGGEEFAAYLTDYYRIAPEGVQGGAYEVAKQITEATALDTRVTILPCCAWRTRRPPARRKRR